MADCVCLPTCIFFNDKMANMPAMTDMYKQRYCRGDSSQCARFAVYSRRGSAGVPTDLFPNELDRARDLLGE